MALVQQVIGWCAWPIPPPPDLQLCPQRLRGLPSRLPQPRTSPPPHPRQLTQRHQRRPTRRNHRRQLDRRPPQHLVQRHQQRTRRIHGHLRTHLRDRPPLRVDGNAPPERPSRGGKGVVAVRSLRRDPAIMCVARLLHRQLLRQSPPRHQHHVARSGTASRRSLLTPRRVPTCATTCSERPHRAARQLERVDQHHARAGVLLRVRRLSRGRLSKLQAASQAGHEHQPPLGQARIRDIQSCGRAVRAVVAHAPMRKPRHRPLGRLKVCVHLSGNGELSAHLSERDDVQA